MKLVVTTDEHPFLKNEVVIVNRFAVNWQRNTAYMCYPTKELLKRVDKQIDPFTLNPYFYISKKSTRPLTFREKLKFLFTGKI